MITRIRGRSGQPGRSSFSRRAHLLTTSRRLAVVSPAGTGALRGRWRFLRKAPDNAAMPVGAGRSAVAAAAYMSCSAILNDYDGVQHDYTKKQGLVWQRVFLPEYALPEWADRAVLWNAVEENEKTKDSRLAREFVVALPIELDTGAWADLLSEFIREQFVSDGMCADVSIHDTDGHNPHAHIMLTVRPLNQNGIWQYKTGKEYLCVKKVRNAGSPLLNLRS